MNNEIKAKILEARQAYVDQLISIATNPLTPAGQVVQASRLLEKALREMDEQEVLQEEEQRSGGDVLVINI